MKLASIFSALAFAVLAGVAVSASAASLPVGLTAVPLATITNTHDTSVSQLELMVNAQATVRGIYLETRANANSDPSTAKGQVYWLSGIESDHGVVLGQGQGVKAILVRGMIHSQDGRGLLTISYLTNGIFRHYAECKIGLERVGPHDWQLVNAYDNRPVEHIEVKTWALGIKTLANVCPGSDA